MACSVFLSGVFLVNFPNLFQNVTIKLNRENYILWKTQVVPILRDANLMGFVDGTCKCPMEYVAALEENGAAQVVNPEFA